MEFVVWRQSPDKQFREIAHTEYVQDAKLIYDHWHAAKVTQHGKTIMIKNIKE